MANIPWCSGLANGWGWGALNVVKHPTFGMIRIDRV